MTLGEPIKVIEYCKVSISNNFKIFTLYSGNILLSRMENDPFFLFPFSLSLPLLLV